MDGQPSLRRASPGWFDVGVGVLLIAGSLVLSLLLGEAMGPQLWAVVASGALLLPIPACFGRLRTDDPRLFAAIALPLAGVATISAALGVAGATPASLVVLALGWVWLVAWVSAFRTMDRWRRTLLRLPPDPDDAFANAWRSYRRRLRDGASTDELWPILMAMGAGASERMQPLLNTWECLFELGPRGDDQVRARRVLDRQQELIHWYNDQPHGQRSPMPNPTRLTEGTRLELLFPELEALLAVATRDERVAMAEAAADVSCARVGIVRRSVEAAIAASPVDAPLRDVAAILKPAAAPRISDDAGASHELELAIASVRAAGDASGSAEHAADAVYYAACPCDDEELATLEGRIRPLVSPHRLLEAMEVVVDAGIVADARLPADRLIPLAMPLVVVASIGFLAGTGGTVVRAATWPLYRDTIPAAEVIAPIVGLFATALIAWLLLRGVGHRLRPNNVLDLFLASVVATVIGGVLMTPASTLIRAVTPGFWESAFAHRTSVMPYAPVFGLVTAAVLLAIAISTRRSAR